METPDTFIGVLRAQAARVPDLVIYRFLTDGETVTASLTCAGLDRRAREIGAELQRRFPPRSRLLLVVPPGPDGISAFYGALCAGMVPVPLFPPSDAASLGRTKKIAADADAAAILSTSELAGMLAQGGMPVIAADEIRADAAAWTDPQPGADDLAFLQYTSGSTGDPKGVMVAHGTLITTCIDIDRAFHHDADSVMVSWLPTFHDMGLIYGVLLPLLIGFPCCLMPPAAFLRKPARWLRAISAFRATHSAAPNFAYDLCVRKTSEAERGALDLSSWRVASSGAEPIRASTLTEFAEAFAPAGFAFQSFCPSYGMAEATLKISTAQAGEGPRILHKTVSCGRSNIGAEILIVDPATATPLAEDETGEIWVSSPSIAMGYWRRPEQTEETFRAKTSDGRGPFLRTGDLGFLHEGELFVTGRIKDLIIVRGRNHYPHDLELTAELADDAVRPGCGAAFVLDEERVAIVFEVREDETEPQAVIRNVRSAIAAEHGVTVADVAVYAPGTLPKTSSGKIRRTACRELLLRGTIEPVAEWHRA